MPRVGLDPNSSAVGGVSQVDPKVTDALNYFNNSREEEDKKTRQNEAANRAGGKSNRPQNPAPSISPAPPLPPKKIAQIQFSLLSPTSMQRLSEIKVTSRNLFTMPSRRPSELGPLDGRLGVSDKGRWCETCGRTISECAGHYGYISLALPVFHIGFFKHTLSILQCICKSCSRVLLSYEERSLYLRHLTSPKSDIHEKAKVLKKVVEACKKRAECVWCRRANGIVKKLTGLPTLKIVHEVGGGGKLGKEAEKQFQYDLLCSEVKGSSSSSDNNAVASRTTTRKRSGDGNDYDDTSTYGKSTHNSSHSSSAKSANSR